MRRTVGGEGGAKSHVVTVWRLSKSLGVCAAGPRIHGLYRIVGIGIAWAILIHGETFRASTIARPRHDKQRSSALADRKRLARYGATWERARYRTLKTAEERVTGIRCAPTIRFRDLDFAG